MKHIVFLPGILGSLLYEGNNTLRKPQFKWYTVKNNKLNRLMIDQNGKSNEIYAYGPLREAFSLVGLGGVIKPNVVYGKIMDSLERFSQQHGYKASAFGYDWRKNINEEIVLEVHKSFSNLKDVEEIIVVGHSMGGLVVKAYMDYLKKSGLENKISKVITIGTPWKGSPDSFQILTNGIQKFLYPNPEITKRLSRTFPSVFQLLPSKQYCDELNYLEDGGRYLNWQESFSQLEKLEGMHVKNTSSINNELYEIINRDWAFEVEHHNIIGVQHGTLSRIPLGNDKTKIKGLDGDATVPLFSALPPNKKSEVYFVKASHMGLVKYPPVLDLVKNLVLKTEKQVIKIDSKIKLPGTYVPQMDWSYVKIDCPVDVYYESEEEDYDSAIQNMTKVTVEDTKFIFQNVNKEEIIEIEAYDEGITHIEFVEVKEDRIESVTKVKSLEANPERKSIVEIKKSKKLENSQVYIESLGEKEPSVVRQIKVPKNVTVTKIPPTNISIKALGKRKGEYYDSQGASITLENESEYVLDTYYKINNEKWKIYEDAIELNGAKYYGENKINYYSVDVFGNRESSRLSKVINMPPEPKMKFTIFLKPDRNPEIGIESYYKGVDLNYKYYLKEKEIVKIDNIKLSQLSEIEIEATDALNNKLRERLINLNIEKSLDLIWSVEGFNGKLIEIYEALGTTKEISFYINGKEKSLDESISGLAKKIEVKKDDLTLEIDLIVNYEIYLYDHSEIIEHNKEEITFEFSVYRKGEIDTEFIPKVVLSYSPPLPNGGTKRISPQKIKKGLYSFSLSTKHMPNVKQLKLEFKENFNSQKNIYEKKLIVK